MTLSGQAIVLELLSLDHGDALEEAVTDRRLWSGGRRDVAPTPEIGATWYATWYLRAPVKRYQRTAVNTEAKLLLLTHAFERLDAIAVEFRTRYMNTAARSAILQLGTKQDGNLRNHPLAADGSYRDTVVLSISEPEWPAVRNNLRVWLQRDPA